METHSSLETFGEEKEGTHLEEERGALHEGLSKILKSLRRGSCYLWSLHGEVIHGVLAFILGQEHAYEGEAHLEEEGRIYYPSVAHWERRTCQIRMRSDA